MDFRKTIKIEDRAPITNWLGDSQVWMKTALDKDHRSGRAQSGVEPDHHELNVAYVCAGLAFELALKALAKSEGRTPTKKHDAGKNYQNLRPESRRVIKAFVEQRTGKTIGDFVAYLDEHMCHPDRKYWMVGRRGEMGSVGFVIGDEDFAIPTVATVHAKIADMVGGNTFEDWRSGTQVRSEKGEHLATGHVNPDGSIRFKITEAGKALGVSKAPARPRLEIVCPLCLGKSWRKGKKEPDPEDRVTCLTCHAEMRAGDVVSWNGERGTSRKQPSPHVHRTRKRGGTGMG